MTPIPGYECELQMTHSPFYGRATQQTNNYGYEHELRLWTYEIKEYAVMVKDDTTDTLSWHAVCPMARKRDLPNYEETFCHRTIKSTSPRQGYKYCQKSIRNIEIQ